jgi:hypothetical protein
MKILDIIIFSLSAIGLIYFEFMRLKYSNNKVYSKKLERLYELRKTITSIENDEKEPEEISYFIINDDIEKQKTMINTVDETYVYNDYPKDKLQELKEEQRKIERYLKIAAKYINN